MSRVQGIEASASVPWLLWQVKVVESACIWSKGTLIKKYSPLLRKLEAVKVRVKELPYSKLI